MKISVYEFPSIYRVYAIVELSEKESKLFRLLFGLSHSEVEKILSKFLLPKARRWRWGIGIAHEEDEDVEFLHVSFEDFELKEHAIEAYPSSLTIISSHSVGRAYELARSFVNYVLDVLGESRPS